MCTCGIDVARQMLDSYDDCAMGPAAIGRLGRDGNVIAFTPYPEDKLELTTAYFCRADVGSNRSNCRDPGDSRREITSWSFITFKISPKYAIPGKRPP